LRAASIAVRFAFLLLLVALSVARIPSVAATSAPPRSPSDEAAEHLLSLLDDERQQLGLAPLQRVPELTAAAQTRTVELAGSFSHTRPEGDLGDLLDAVGLPWRECGESLATVNQPSAPRAAAERAHALLMASATHRELLLSPDFEYVGVSANLRAERWYFVQILMA
jgi:uncharacterized protein YkwD